MLKGLFHFLLAYKGAPEWLPQSGFGDILVAPVYEVLARRGVRFEFFHRVHHLHLDAEGRRIDRIVVERQATPIDRYEPIAPVNGIPCWPSAPFYDQLVEGAALREQRINLESFWTPWRGTMHELVYGTDFDQVLLGISIAALPGICAELVDESPAWRDMVTRVETNRPVVVQTWFTKTLEDMGWRYGVVNGDIGTQPLNLLTSMNQILPRESWPADATPRSLIYYSGVMPDDPDQPGPGDAAYPARQQAQLEAASIAFLEQYAADLHARRRAWRTVRLERAGIGETAFAPGTGPVRCAVLARQHRSVGALCAVGHRQLRVSDDGGRIGLRQPVPGRRLDSDRLQRRLHGSHDHLGHRSCACDRRTPGTREGRTPVAAGCLVATPTRANEERRTMSVEAGTCRRQGSG